MSVPATSLAAEYAIEPEKGKKFIPSQAKEAILKIMQAKLQNVSYHADHSSTLARELADEIKHRMKDFDWPRYKYVVQVVLGELRGEGVKMGCRNFWDPNTDSYAQEVYMNESLFCVAAVFGLYLY